MMSDPEPLSADRIKHLEFIQAVITRLGNSSFLIKGWTLTIATAFFAFLSNHPNWKIATVAFLPLLSFWLLDAYYLRHERLFRLLYDDARRPKTSIEPFSMDFRVYAGRVRSNDVVFSVTLRRFYGALLVVNFAFTLGFILRAIHLKHP